MFTPLFRKPGLIFYTETHVLLSLWKDDHVRRHNGCQWRGCQARRGVTLPRKDIGWQEGKTGQNNKKSNNK